MRVIFSDGSTVRPDSNSALSAAQLAHKYGRDLLMVPDHVSAPKLFLADMDSTMIAQECIDELADYAGVKDDIAAITASAMRGELDFEASLKARVKLLAGLSEHALQQCYEERITLMPGAETLMAGLKKRGIRCVLVSGGFTFFTSRIAARLGFDRHVANEFEIINGKLTGNVIPPVRDAATKATVLAEECATLGIAPLEAITVGDGANDIHMTLAAGCGFAAHAKPKLREAANGIIDQGDLSDILRYIDGI